MQSQNFIGGAIVLSKAGLTGLSGAATTYTIGAAIVYALYGKAYNKAAVAGAATPTNDAITNQPLLVGIGYGTCFLFCLDAAGNVRVIRGSHELLDPTTGNFLAAPPQFPPNVPDTLVPFAYATIKNVASANTLFYFGVSPWNQAGVTITVQDIIFMPNRPQLS